MREALEKMLAAGKDSAMLRFSLGMACAKEDDHATAVEHLRRAVEMDASLSAAWKQLGKSLLASGDGEEAGPAWQRGIAVAEENGDKQAVKEMQVFLRRLLKHQGDSQR